MKKPRTATQKAIDNINSYINKVGSFFGINSPEYEKITNQLKPFETYTNKQGFTVIKNTKANRAKHQTIRAINKNKPSFARQKKKYLKEQKTLFPTMEIPTIDFDDIVAPSFDAVHSSGVDNEPLDFDTWYKNWRATWMFEEQYEIRNLADKMGVPFDHIQWYQDYTYRESILTELFQAYEDGINSELSQTQNENGDTFDYETGETFSYTNNDLNDGFNPDFGWN